MPSLFQRQSSYISLFIGGIIPFRDDPLGGFVKKPITIKLPPGGRRDLRAATNLFKVRAVLLRAEPLLAGDDLISACRAIGAGIHNECGYILID